MNEPLVHGSQAAPSDNARLQGVAVVLLSLLAMTLFLPAAYFGWQDRGTFGFTTLRLSNAIRTVALDSPAGRAGIHKGDRIDMTSLPLLERVRLDYPAPNQKATFVVISGHSRSEVTLIAQAAKPMPEYLRWLVFGEFLTWMAFIIIGATLVFLRPAPMTWWLWLYCLGIVPVNELIGHYWYVDDETFFTITVLARFFLGGLSAIPLLPFLLRFPFDKLEGWRRRLRPPSVTFAILACVYYAVIIWRALSTVGTPYYSLLNALPAAITYFAGAAILVVTYTQARGLDRQRLKWAVFGMSFTFFAQLLVYLPIPAFLTTLAETISVVMPLSVAYAALRHRLIDVHFVINRAIVYGVLTATLVAFVSLLDWISEHFLADFHLAVYAEAGLTIGLGFVLNKLHRQLEAATDVAFFRARRRAEQHLKRVAASLAYADRLDSIDESLVDEPLHAFELASAAVFHYDEQTSGFVRGRSIGWGDAHESRFERDDAVVRYLEVERGPLRAGAIRSLQRNLPHGLAAPALLVPVLSRQQMQAFVVYGAHADGADIDPDELESLAALAPGAAAAFDHVDMLKLQAELDAYRKRAEVEAAIIERLRPASAT